MSVFTDLIGKKVIIRTYSAGVHFGTLDVRCEKEVQLSNTRRIWYWSGSASLSELSDKGPANPDACKFPAATPLIVLTEAIEIIPCSDLAAERIEGVKPWTAHEAA